MKILNPTPTVKYRYTPIFECGGGDRPSARQHSSNIIINLYLNMGVGVIFLAILMSTF